MKNRKLIKDAEYRVSSDSCTGKDGQRIGVSVHYEVTDHFNAKNIRHAIQDYDDIHNKISKGIDEDIIKYIVVKEINHDCNDRSSIKMAIDMLKEICADVAIDYEGCKIVMLFFSPIEYFDNMLKDYEKDDYDIGNALAQDFECHALFGNTFKYYHIFESLRQG